ncbi:hypothetical protein [Longimicrobium sp.]|jgi:hypothetical protein|uniref:hypothetical protein n=1 Tax=Longimicrobium sp. TaxID=2029185 RepID=UPI002ED8E58A
MRHPLPISASAITWLMVGACAPAVQRPVAEQILMYRGRDVEAVMADGRRVRLANPQVTADSVYGAWTADSGGQPIRVAVALAEVRSIRVVSPSAVQREMGGNGVQEAALVVLAGLALLALLTVGAAIF